MRRVTLRPLDRGGSETRVRFGSTQLVAPCDASDPDSLALPETLMTKLGLMPGDSLNLLVHNQDGSLQMGPLVGMLVSPGSPGRMFRGWRKEYYEALTQHAALAGAVAFCFTVDGLSVRDALVEGWINRNSVWQRVTLPLPDVIYNRATYRNRKLRQAAAEQLDELHLHYGTMLINPPNAFSKSVVAAALSFFPHTRRLTPETVPFSDPAALHEMLNKYDCVVVKSDDGSHGSEVLRIRQRRRDWEVAGSFGERRMKIRFTSRKLLVSFLEYLCGNTPCVVQQGIDLARVDGRLFDLRVILQKDGSNSWRAPLVLVRLAHPAQVVSNTSRGGEAILPDSFRKRFGDQLAGVESMEEVALTASLSLADALESRLGRLGEIGVDVGIDRNGRPWILEANAKPFHRWLPDSPQPLNLYPLQYAVYLAEDAWRGRITGLPSPILARGRTET